MSLKNTTTLKKIVIAVLTVIGILTILAVGTLGYILYAIDQLPH